MENKVEINPSSTFAKKVWITVGITAFVVIMILILYKTFHVLLLLMASSLIAVFLNAVSNNIRKWTGLGSRVSLAVTIVLIIGLLGLFFWMVGAEAQVQFNEMQETVPIMIDNAQSYLNKSEIGRNISEYVSDIENQKKVLPFLQSFFTSSFGVFGDLYIVIFLSLFLAIAPFEYANGIVNLVPRAGKIKAKQLLENLGSNLKKWMKGAIVSGFVISTFIAIALLILGIDMWLILAIFAGLLNIIPNFGPIIAMIPGVLVALLISPTLALLVAGSYILSQTIEGNLITPNIQKKLLNIPPALMISFQVLMGILLGGWGIVLAVPMLVIVITVVKSLYLDENMGLETSEEEAH